MTIPRKYLTSYVVIGSILIFSLKDCLGLIHTVLHALPNPYHHRAELSHTHDGQVTHNHQIPPVHPHDLMDHVAHGNHKDPVSQGDREEIKTIAGLTWNIQELFSLQLIKPDQFQVAVTFFTIAHTQLPSTFPPTPPPEFS